MSHLFKRCVHLGFLISANSHNSVISIVNHNKVAPTRLTLLLISIKAGLGYKTTLEKLWRTIEAGRTRGAQILEIRERDFWVPHSSLQLSSAFCQVHGWGRRAESGGLELNRGLMLGTQRLVLGLSKNWTWGEKNNCRQVSGRLHEVYHQGFWPLPKLWGVQEETSRNQAAGYSWRSKGLSKYFSSLILLGKTKQQFRD